MNFCKITFDLYKDFNKIKRTLEKLLLIFLLNSEKIVEPLFCALKSRNVPLKIKHTRHAFIMKLCYFSQTVWHPSAIYDQ
jgi:hypothetical protein